MVQAFADIKNYYNDITHNNLDLIKSLKEDVHEMKKKEQQVPGQQHTTPPCCCLDGVRAAAGAAADAGACAHALSFCVGLVWLVGHRTRSR